MLFRSKMITRVPPGDYDDWLNPVWTANIHGNSGSAGCVDTSHPEKDAVTRLRETVAEVTRGRIPVLAKRGPGFY